jgi:hypothetical protein
MTELPLDDQQRNSFTGHLNRVGMTLLVRGEPTPNPDGLRNRAELAADPGRRTWPTLGRSAQHAEQCTDRQRPAQLEPRLELLPVPPVHPDLAALAALCCARNYVAYASEARRGSGSWRGERALWEGGDPDRWVASATYFGWFAIATLALRPDHEVARLGGICTSRPARNSSDVCSIALGADRQVRPLPPPAALLAFLERLRPAGNMSRQQGRIPCNGAHIRPRAT